jgi:hypothetical protein
MRLRRLRNTQTMAPRPEPKPVEHGNKVMANGLAWMLHEVVDFKAGLNCDEGAHSFCGCTASWRGAEFCPTVWLAAPIEMVVVALGSVFALAKAQD